MADYVSDAWFDDLERRVAASGVRAGEDGDWSIMVRVSDGDQVWEWTLAVTNEGVAVHRDTADGAPARSVRISTDRSTGAAIASGALSAQRAVMAGALRLGGDVGLLIRNAEALAVVGGAPYSGNA